MQKLIQFTAFLFIAQSAVAWAGEDQAARRTATADRVAALSDHAAGLSQQCKPEKIKALAEILAFENCSDPNEVFVRQAEKMLCNASS